MSFKRMDVNWLDLFGPYLHTLILLCTLTLFEHYNMYIYVKLSALDSFTLYTCSSKQTAVIIAVTHGSLPSTQSRWF